MNRKKLLIALAIGGGIYFFMKKSSTPATDIPGDYNPEPSGGGGFSNYLPNDQIPVYTTPENPLSSYDNASTYFGYLANIFGTSSPYLDAFNVMNDAQLVNCYNLTTFFAPSNTKYWDAFTRMTQQELYYSWYYVGSYLQPGKELLYQTKLNANGTWANENPGNPELYNAIVAINKKYGIF